MPAAETFVTVAIPTHNRASGLRTALESVLNQTHRNLEIIISDNNTTEEIRPIVDSFGDPRVKYFKHSQTLPMTANWNFCLAKASGEFFLLLSDDDFLFPDAVSRLLAAFGNRSAGFAYGRAIFENERGRKLGISSAAPRNENGKIFIKKSLAFRRQALPSFTLFRAEAARGLGGYPETGNSTDLALRLSLAVPGDVACVHAPVGVYMIHPDSMTGDISKTIESFELFSSWSAQPGSPLFNWKGLIYQYSAASLRKRARGLALRGEIVPSRMLNACAAALSGSQWYDDILLCIFSNPAVRVLAGIRRVLK